VQHRLKNQGSNIGDLCNGVSSMDMNSWIRKLHLMQSVSNNRKRGFGSLKQTSLFFVQAY